MFYPENALVKRTPGIATIWLMATLGARQNSRKVSKSAILQVDIPEACDAVHDPQAPMALRLQSNLLYGISRVYSQQCLYILSDAEAARVALKNVSKLMKTSELDVLAGVVRPETLIVPDDPSCLPEFQFDIVDFNVSAFDSSESSFRSNGTRSDVSNVSTRSNKSLHNSDPLHLDVFDSGSFGDLPALPPLNTGPYPFSRQLSSDVENEGLLQDLGFEFDESGNLVDHDVVDEGAHVARTPHQFDLGGQGLHSEAILNDQNALPQDVLEDEFRPADGQELQRFDREQVSSGADVTTYTSISEYIEPPPAIRKRNKSTVLPRDTVLQISNAELQRAQADYTRDMQMARYLKLRRQESRHARQDMAFLLGGSNQYDIMADTTSTLKPLSRFSMDVFEHLTKGTATKTSKRKRAHASSSSTDSTGSETRTNRLRLDQDVEQTRADVLDEDGYPPLADDLDPSVELARQAMTALEDYSTQLPLPWSISRPGSIHSNRQSRHSSVLSARGQVHRTVSQAGSVHSFDRRASRLPSVSPIIGRGSIHRSEQQAYGSNISLHNPGPSGFTSGGNTSPERQRRNSEDFELFGPAADVPTQEANDSQWLRDTLNKESTEFLAWIQTSIDAKHMADSDGEHNISHGIKFDELLPIHQHSRAVAAQGFLHVLILANKGMINVTQDSNGTDGHGSWWGAIDLALVATAVADEDQG